MLRQLDAWEFLHWQVYEELDPFGNDRLDWLAGLIATSQTNALRGENDRPVTPLDVIPDWGGLRAASEQQTRQSASKEDWLEWLDAVKRLEEDRG